MPPKAPQKFKQLPTEQAWLQATTITTGWYVHRRKNVDLLAIDGALRSYWVSAGSSRAGETAAARLTRVRIQALNLLDIIKKCKIWLDHKVAGRKIDSSNRADMVRMLSLCAKVELDKLAADVGRLDQVGHKMHTPQPGGKMTPHNATPAERQGARIRWAMAKGQLFQGKGKRLDQHAITEANVGGINPTHMEGGALQFQFGNQANYKFLFDFVRQANAQISDIVYLTTDERWQHQIRLVGGLAYRLQSENGDIGDVVRAGYAGNFIISNDQHLYLVDSDAINAKIDQQRAVTSRDTEFRHSSFMAGKPVFFAGAIQIDPVTPGKIVVVDNASGHYRPTFAQFKQALELLQQLGVEMRDVHAQLLSTEKVWYEEVEDPMDAFPRLPATVFLRWTDGEFATAMRSLALYVKGDEAGRLRLTAMGVRDPRGGELMKTVPPPSQPAARPAAKPSWSPFRR